MPLPSGFVQQIRDLGVGVVRAVESEGVIDLTLADGGSVRIRPETGRMAITKQGEGAGDLFRALGHELRSGPVPGQLLSFTPGDLNSLFQPQSQPQAPTGGTTAGGGGAPTGGVVPPANLQTALDTSAQRPGAIRAQNPLIASVQDIQRQTVGAQQAAVGRFGAAGREAIMAASPELQQLSGALLQRAQDPGGGGFREDLQERIRVQQAAAGLSGGGQAAFQEAALTSRALEQRRLEAGGALQRLGGTFLQQLGLGAPIVADLAGVGQTELAGQTLAAVQAANEAQANISRQILGQLFGLLGGQFQPIQGQVSPSDPRLITSGTQTLPFGRSTVVQPGMGQTVTVQPGSGNIFG